MVVDIFEIITEAVTQYVGVLVSMFQSIISVFYVADTGFTLLGILLLIGISIGIVKWGFNLVKNLVRL